VKPIVAISKRYAVGCFPWHSSFGQFSIKSGNCPPVCQCSIHTRPITCLAISGHYFVSASRDCTVRLWTLDDEGPKTIGYHARHRQPIVFVRINERLNESVSISRDGFMMSMSLTDGRCLREVYLPMSDPSDMIISDRGYICVAFNGPDSHLILVLDHNLVTIVKNSFDGCLQCWTTIERNGVEYLLIGLKTKRILTVQIPYLDGSVPDIEIPFSPSLMASGRQDGNCYVATSDGALMTFTIPLT
jgi:WD40 repeat protein